MHAHTHTYIHTHAHTHTHTNTLAGTEEGTVQVEHFGMHINVDGTIFYGIKVEAIKSRTAEKVLIAAPP